MPEESLLLTVAFDPPAVLRAAIEEIRSLEGRLRRALRVIAEIEAATLGMSPDAARKSRVNRILVELRCDLDTPDLVAYRRELVAAWKAVVAKRSDPA